MWPFDKKTKPAALPPARRDFTAAKKSRITAGYHFDTLTPNKKINTSISDLRSLARGLVDNNDFAKNYLNILDTQVIGSEGITIKSRITDPIDKAYDNYKIGLIEGTFKDWSQAQYASVDKRLTFKQIQSLALRTVARDGECFIRIVRNFPNKYGFALQVISPDSVSERKESNKPYIRAGIEYNEWMEPIAYHVTSNRASSALTNNNSINLNQESVRIPAADMIHLMKSDFSGQNRGYSWFHSCLNSLNILEQYEQAELIGAKISASKMGFYVKKDQEAANVDAEFLGTETQADGTIIQEVEPGAFEVMPDGYELQTFDTNNPNANYAAFNKAVLTKIASGLGISYSTLSGDLTEVNYSSIRAGLLLERDFYASLQSWLTDSFLDRVFAAWLETIILKGITDFGMSEYEDLFPHSWQCRRWPQVDPTKEVDANIKAINNGIKSLSQVIGESGRDPIEVFNEIQKDQIMLEDMHIHLENMPEEPLDMEMVDENGDPLE